MQRPWVSAPKDSAAALPPQSFLHWVGRVAGCTQGELSGSDALHTLRARYPSARTHNIEFSSPAASARHQSNSRLHFPFQPAPKGTAATICYALFPGMPYRSLPGLARRTVWLPAPSANSTKPSCSSELRPQLSFQMSAIRPTAALPPTVLEAPRPPNLFSLCNT